jgi:transposase
MESSKTQSYIGIDVAKEHLDICWPDQKIERIANERKALRAFIRRVRKAKAAMTLVCESSGGYERLLVRVARDADVPICVANPARVRYFAKGKGILAKTDSIDAGVVQAFGEENQPRPARKESPSEETMRAWVVRRTQLTDELAREKKRLGNSPELIKESIQRMIKLLEEEIAQVEARIEEAQKADPVLTAQAAVLEEVCGVGPVTVWTLQAFLNELGEVSRRRIVSLVGLAPWPNESGLKKGRRTICGGRTRVRCALYMAATSARQHNPHLRDYYQRLLAKNKPEKVVIVAVMRKLLVHLNSLIQEQKKLKKEEIQLA